MEMIAVTTMTEEDKEKESIRAAVYAFEFCKHSCGRCGIGFTKDALTVVSVSKEAAVIKIKCTKCGTKLGIALVGRKF